MISIVSILMQMPLLSIVEALFFVVSVVYAFCIMYHLMRFGVGPNPKLLSLIFFVGFCVFFMSVFTLFYQVDMNTVTERLRNEKLFNFQIMP